MGRQVAHVSVDGAPAGDWPGLAATPDQEWADQAITLPANPSGLPHRLLVGRPVRDALGGADPLAEIRGKLEQGADDGSERDGQLRDQRWKREPGRLATGESSHEFNQPLDGGELAAQDVRLTETALVMDEQDPVDQVVHVHEVEAGLGEDLHRHPARTHLVDEDAELGGVARSVHPAGLGDEDGRPLVHPRFRLLVSEVLRLLVVGEELDGLPVIGLVQHLAVGVPEHAVRRDVNDAPHPGIDGGIEHPLGSFDVRVVHGGVFGGPDADPVHGAEVESGVASRHAAADDGSGPQIALHEFASELAELACLVRGTDQRDDVIPARPKPFGETASDEPCPAGDKRLH